MIKEQKNHTVKNGGGGGDLFLTPKLMDLKTIKTLEIYGGIGSPRKALERVIKDNNLNTRIKKIDYVEWWGWAVDAYNHLFDSREIPQNVIGWNLNVDILVHGSPCTRFSNASNSFYKNNDFFVFAKEYGAKEQHAPEEYKDFFEKYGLPLYSIIDNHDCEEHFKTQINEMERLNKRGRLSYKEKSELDKKVKEYKKNYYLHGCNSDKNHLVNNVKVFKSEFEKFMRTSGLYFETLRIIEKELTPRPKVVIWENVKGLLNSTNIESFNHYLKTMEEFGYENHYEVLNSKDFGIPQSRNRVFVVSIRKDQTDFNSNFNFKNLIKTPMKKLKNFLEPHNQISKEYFITAKSMVSAIEKGKIKIVDDYVETIIGAQQKWNSNGFVKVSLHPKPFNSTDFVHDPETASMHTLDTNSANNRIAVPVKERTGKVKIDINGFDQESRVYNPNNDEAYTDALTTNHKSSKVAVPIIESESKDFANFKTLPRTSDGELINGSHNRYWKDDKYVGTLTASADTKIMVKINEDYDYRMSDGSKRPIGKINKEGNITIPLTTNHTKNKVGVDIMPTLTTQEHNILVDAIEPIEGVPIWIIDGKPYHLRVLTQREAWRLMGWTDEDIDKVIHMPKTHLYKMAGNAIVVQVLEAIFKELLKETNENNM